MAIRKLLTVLLVLGFAGALAACDTMRGFGQDVEDTGESIQEEAD